MKQIFAVLILIALSTSMIMADDPDQTALQPVAGLQVDPGLSVLLEKYDKNTIYLQNRFWSGTKYVINDVEYPVGFMGSNLIKELSSAPDALDLAQGSKDDNMLALLGIGGAVLSTFLMTGDDPTIGLVAYFGAITFAIVKQYSAANKLQQAIWKYNREKALKK